jgi:hypothetical protein
MRSFWQSAYTLGKKNFYTVQYIKVSASSLPSPIPSSKSAKCINCKLLWRFKQCEWRPLISQGPLSVANSDLYSVHFLWDLDPDQGAQCKIRIPILRAGHVERYQLQIYRFISPFCNTLQFLLFICEIVAFCNGLQRNGWSAISVTKSVTQ